VPGYDRTRSRSERLDQSDRRCLPAYWTQSSRLPVCPKSDGCGGPARIGRLAGRSAGVLPRRVMIPRALLLLTASLLAGCAGSSASRGSPAGLFREAAEETGLVFHHFNGATGEYYLPEILGPGVALFDYDGDGDLDIFLV